MFKDSKPVRGFEHAQETVSVARPDGEWAQARANDELFEDILDIEGSLRIAASAVSGFSMPGGDELESGLRLLEGRIPMDDYSQMRADADRVRAAAQADDAEGVKAAQTAIVNRLVQLRNAIS
ncbi:hypothetical protein GR702_07455 [Novosphingobium sp. FGD1]|uniref:Uncharacterized protein n=1 Tax=Novosphingobium silvae TaxID=2692619 RepID=A0A7X4GG22_9SPHN|nr:hypothetical protein [Novosphingobium silvae]MYL97609.1 hypothetical protein [Novosphingobium silvae]